LVGTVEKRLRKLLMQIATEMEATVHALEIMPDHVHIFVESDPTRGVAELVNRFKGRTSHDLRQEFESLRTRIPTLWSRSYYAATVGAVSQETIRRYIEAQKGK